MKIRKSPEIPKSLIYIPSIYLTKSGIYIPKIDICKCQYAHFAHIRLSFGCTDGKMDFGMYSDTSACDSLRVLWVLDPPGSEYPGFSQPHPIPQIPHPPTPCWGGGAPGGGGGVLGGGVGP